MRSRQPLQRLPENAEDNNPLSQSALRVSVQDWSRTKALAGRPHHGRPHRLLGRVLSPSRPHTAASKRYSDLSPSFPCTPRPRPGRPSPLASRAYPPSCSPRSSFSLCTGARMTIPPTFRRRMAGKRARAVRDRVRKRAVARSRPARRAPLDDTRGRAPGRRGRRCFGVLVPGEDRARARGRPPVGRAHRCAL
jgi:hypothetical protein